MRTIFILYISFFYFQTALFAQLQWQNVDPLFQPLPPSVHIFRTNSPLDGKPNIAYYLEADLKDKALFFTVDTTYKRRLTPTKFYERNNRPLVVVNTTFFSFASNQNLNLVIKDKKLIGYNIHTIPGRGRDTFTFRHPLGSAIGISSNREADIAWTYTDSSMKHPLAWQVPVQSIRDSLAVFAPANARKTGKGYQKWKMKTAVGGGPVLLQRGGIMITNNEELRFAGKAIDDKHPRTAIGYTKDNKLIILVVEGRHPGKADGASLSQMARIFRDLGCWEAMNLDGGGSSCMLVNGRETIRVSDIPGQRAVPAVFVIRAK